jgi:phosphoenolpyruvate---glycerone phosphotransferase subunit DhaK
MQFNGMKKFLNEPDDFVLESVSGFVESHPDMVAWNRSPLYVRRRLIKRKGVAVISGGGSGHEPLDIGYVGSGMLDAACPGSVFTAPTPGQIVAAAQHVARADGVVLIVKNYAGDLKSFELARDMLDMPVSWVLVNDDVASASPDRAAGRRIWPPSYACCAWASRLRSSGTDGASRPSTSTSAATSIECRR